MQEEQSDKPRSANKIKIIVVGAIGVGKTCLFLRLNKNYFKESFLSTIGVDRITKTFKYKNEIYKINIVDTAGQDRYRTLPAKYYINADGVFLLFDLTDKQSFNDLSLWMKELNKHVGNPGENKKGPVVYLLGNKLDKLDRVITTDEAEEKANFYDIKYFEINHRIKLYL